jgi:hypothetical protein
VRKDEFDEASCAAIGGHNLDRMAWENEDSFTKKKMNIQLYIGSLFTHWRGTVGTSPLLFG